MVQPTRHIWMDGKLVAWDQAQVHVLTYTLHYGLAAFEGIRAYDIGDGQGSVFRLPEHAQRLVDSARIYRLDIPWNVEQVADAVVETFAANGMTEGYARPLAYVGQGAMGLYAYTNPLHLCVAVWPWGAYLGEEGRANGIRCMISTFGRFSGRAMLSKGKVAGHYVNSILAKEEAIRLGFDEALMCDADGHVLEGSGENLFMVRGDTIFTPPREADILGGITRDTVCELAEELDYDLVEGLFSRDDLYLADEVFLTGTAAEVTPVREIDARVIGSGRCGPVTKALQKLYDFVVRGKVDEHADWLTTFRPGDGGRSEA